jgi:alpha-tubulin suppressor-like RCC1 family protein
MDNQSITHSSQLPKIRIPKRVVLPNKIINIGIGTYHVVAVGENGEAYSWGKGNQGQLGIDKF